MSVPSFEEALRAGAACFNRGKFFEAHEEWEERWLMETGDRKKFLHGLIQIAAGFVKINIKEWPSADGLFEEAQIKLEDFSGETFGVDLDPLLSAVAHCQSEVRMILRGMFDSFDPAAGVGLIDTARRDLIASAGLCFVERFVGFF
jgi:predicted metal-dependent hydrolase